jgi:predicted nucleic acid-binding Zn ribbon protein
MTDPRHCDQCGTAFVPRREHARFCSGRCRVGWNHGRRGDPVTEASALAWSVVAMDDMTRRLPLVRARDRARALAIIGEVVWQVTIVDATLVRYYPDRYDDVLAAQPPAARRRTEGTLSGLRFVRNKLRDEAGYGDFVSWPGSSGPAASPLTAWTWQPVPAPALDALPPSGQSWESTRYGDYREFLARRPVGETFGWATSFLTQAAAPAVAGLTAPAAS